jgi:hypothetical protein
LAARSDFRVARTVCALIVRIVRNFRIFKAYGLPAEQTSGYKVRQPFDEQPFFAMSAKFYFYFFWASQTAGGSRGV